MDQELPLQGMKWLVLLESKVLLSEVGWAQFPVTRSPQKTLVGLVFALTVAGVALVYLVAGKEAFVTDGSPDPSLCEKINDTPGLSIRSITTHTRKSPYENSYNNQH
jgi:hypothetical protein